jgi:DeoR family ulaG and ulaABCDEF operon transcriptional repressor
MHAQERQRAILRTLHHRGFLGIAELTALTDASEATVRRDLSALHEAGHIKRVRGGAERAHSIGWASLAGQPSFFGARMEHVPEKRAIARTAVEMLEPDDAVIIGGGTTTLMMAEHLVDGKLTVLTPSFPLAERLLHETSNEVILPGGPVYREQQIVVSPYDEPSVQNYWARLMIVGALGLGVGGLTESDHVFVRAQRQLMERAERVVVLVDSSKFRRQGSMVVCGLDRIDTVITDPGIEPGSRSMLVEAGCDVVVAPVAENAHDDS